MTVAESKVYEILASMGKVNLYHGSYIEIKQPRILTPVRALDFGAGFYTTSSFSQAKSWAKRQIRMRTISENLDKHDQAIVTNYLFDRKGVREELNILIFESPDSQWLEFVSRNRTLKCVKNYDLIIGPVADDKTMAVVSDYIRGRYSQSEAIKRLKPFKLDDQYTFTNQKALKYLTYEGAERVDEN